MTPAPDPKRRRRPRSPRSVRAPPLPHRLDARVSSDRLTLTLTLSLSPFSRSPLPSLDRIGRKSKYSLYDEEVVTFEEDSVYDQKDAQGFIKLQALRLRTLAQSRSL